MEINHKYMHRALELARMGELGAHPNPMVGAVIVAPDGRIVGEGYHAHCGQGHAEVNAVHAAGIADLSNTTLYVTLEPCSHWGKTPPCALLIIEKKIPRVVVGTVDSFAKVHGRGIAMLREAGVEVEILDGDIAEECRDINRRFFTAHTLKRPYVALKWAQTADGYVDRYRISPTLPPLRISTPETQIAMHHYRATFDAIAVGSNTLRLDTPRLDCRLWPGARNPMRISFTRHPSLLQQLQELYKRGITSVLIEGGPTLQRAFIDANIVDEIRVETNNLISLPEGGVPAPNFVS